MIHKILVALDGSDSAKGALEFAIDLAGKYHAEIVLFSVLQPVITPIYSFEGVTPNTDAYYTKVETFSKKMLSEAVKRVKRVNPQLKVSTRLDEGRPAKKIVQITKELGCDLIVMGSRGLSGIKELFLGSVSNRVADEAPCPVLLVKYPIAETEG